jgi:hypothetical protein
MMSEEQYQNELGRLRDLGAISHLTARDIRETFTYAHQLSGYRVATTAAKKRARVAILSAKC